MALNWDRLKDVCTSIKAVVISQKERLTIEQLRKDYRNIEGEDIPYLELGFKSVRSLLESIPEHVRLVTYNGIEYVIQVDNERTKQISQFVAGQKTATKNNNKKFRGCRPNIGYSYQQRHPTLVNQHRTNLDREDLAFIINQVNRYPNGLTRNQIIDFLHQRDRFLKLPGHTLDHYLGQLAQNHKICLKDSLILPIIEDRPSSVPFVRQQVANNYTNSMTRNNSSLTERRNILPAECMLDDPDEVEEMFDDQEEEKACAKMNGKHTEEPISDRIKFRVLKLVEEHEDGIWCAELPKLYEAKYKIGLDYTEFGFGSVAEFVDHLQNYTLKQPKPRGDFKIYLKKPHENGNISQNQKQSTASLYNVYDPSYENKQAVPKTLKTDSKKRMIPEDVLSFDETVGQESVLELNDGDDVVVCEVFDPSFFWVKKVDQINPLKKLMYELGEFYKEKFKSYSIPPIILQNGLNVACKYQNMWHRAVILSVRTDGLVTILFYDYGTINLRDPNELCFLHRKFSTLPAIAIPCGLYNMMPALGNRWLRHAVIEFTDMCYDKPSKIEVKSIDKDTNSAMVHLCTGRMYVHQKMIEKQLAVEGNVVSSTIDNYFLLICPNAHPVKYAAKPIQKRCTKLKNTQSTSEEDFCKNSSAKDHMQYKNRLRRLMKNRTINKNPEMGDLSSLRDKLKTATTDSSSSAEPIVENRPQLQMFVPINPDDRKINADKEPTLHGIFKPSEAVVDWDKFKDKERSKQMKITANESPPVSTNQPNLRRLNSNSLEACVQKCNFFYERSKQNLCWTMQNNGFHYEKSHEAYTPLELLQPWKNLPEKVKLAASKDYLEDVQSKLSTTSEDASSLSEDDMEPLELPEPVNKVLIEEISSHAFTPEEIKQNEKQPLPVLQKVSSSPVSRNNNIEDMLHNLQSTADRLFYGRSNSVDSDDVDCTSQAESVSIELPKIDEQSDDHHNIPDNIPDFFDLKWDVVYRLDAFSSFNETNRDVTISEVVENETATVSSNLDTSESESNDSPLASISSNLDSDVEPKRSHSKLLPENTANGKKFTDVTPKITPNGDNKPKGKFQALFQKRQKLKFESQVD